MDELGVVVNHLRSEYFIAACPGDLVSVAVTTRRPVEPSLTDLVAEARRGEQLAWSTIVDRLQRVVWKTVNACTRDSALRQDAFAATWMRLAENIHKIDDPECLPGWLATTSRREVLNLIAKESRFIPTDPGSTTFAAMSATVEVDTEPVSSARRNAIRDAFQRLSLECRELLGALVLSDPPLSYAEVGELLGRPHGSLGPTKLRCLERLRRDPSIVALIRERRTHD
jgi:RNA polymerase sigma factor (sigma-70 family)